MSDTIYLSFYYPGFYNCDLRNKSAQKEINEWNLLKSYENSCLKNVPKIEPLWDLYDSSNEKIINKEIEIASKYQIDAFVFNYYFNGYKTELEKPLKIFLKENQKLKFALNWCHRMPKRNLPISPVSPQRKAEHIIHDLTDEELKIEIKLKPSDFVKLADKFCDYFKSNYYLTLNNKYVLTFYHLTGMISSIGIDNLITGLTILRESCRKRGYKLYLIGLLSITNEKKNRIYEINRLPLDAISAYCSLPNFNSKDAIQRFEELIPQRTQEWNRNRELFTFPFFPCIAAGWDATSRGDKGYKIEKHGLKFPFVPVVINNTASNFKRYLNSAKSFINQIDNSDYKLLFLGPWNEWTEGCYLLPCKKFKYSKLEVIKNSKQK